MKRALIEHEADEASALADCRKRKEMDIAADGARREQATAEKSSGMLDNVIGMLKP